MDLQALEAHIKEIEDAIQKSAATHHALIGRLEGVKHIYEQMKVSAPVIEAIAEAV